MKLPSFKKFKRKKNVEVPEKIFEKETLKVHDIISPSFIEETQTHLKIGERMVKSFFIFSYPRYLSTGWMSPLINLDIPMNISMFFDPIPSSKILKELRKKVTHVQAEIMEREEKGLIRDPALETAYRDIESLREHLQTAQEKMFRMGLYIAVYIDKEKDLIKIETALRSILESKLIYIKPALYQQKKGFISCNPYGIDKLQVNTAMNTGPLSSIFPFISFDLSSNEGILYGVNQHNSSLVLFDRFSLENANSVVFAKAGSGKSFAVKLEILRYLMLGVDTIIVDPENEYKFLSDAVNGSFFNMSLSSKSHINPFDLPTPREDEDPRDVLRGNIINLVGLFRIMLGGLTPEEDAILDRAINETYSAKDITPDSDPAIWGEKAPLMSDLESVLETMEGAESLSRRIGRFTQGVFADFFNQPSNINMKNKFVAFGIRDMEDELRPMAMFIILRYIWNSVRSELKKRILVIDEAWWLMKTENGASFLYGIAKRARKYWLGVTTITQDVDDFMKSEYGKPIITNSSLQLLMKQSPATIEVVKKAFNLTSAEKNMLLQCSVGEGLFFAGEKHIAMRVVASYAEDQIITTAPEEVLKIKQAKQDLKSTEY